MAGQNQRMRRLIAIMVGGLILASCKGALANPVELTLADSVALALKNNPSLAISVANKESSAWAIRQAAAGWGPTLTFTNSDQRSYDSTLQPPASSNFSNSFSVTQPLYTGGLVDEQVDQAKLNYKIADLSLSQTKQQLQQSATTGYFTVLQARHMVQVDQQSVDDLATHLDIAKAQYKIGTIAQTDVLSSEVALANAQDTLIREQNSYDLAMANLNNVIGLPPDTQITLKEDLQHEKYTLSLEDCVNYALHNNPQVSSAQTSIAVAKDSVAIANSNYKPTVKLNGVNDWANSTFPGVGNENWSLTLTGTWNVYNSGLTKAVVEQAKTGVTVAKEQQIQTGDTVSLAVRQAYLSMKEAEKRIDTSKVAVDEAAENFMINTVRYKIGAGTNLDVLDAELALSTANTNYIQALYDYNTDIANLNAAMGIEVK